MYVYTPWNTPLKTASCMWHHWPLIGKLLCSYDSAQYRRRTRMTVSRSPCVLGVRWGRAGATLEGYDVMILCQHAFFNITYHLTSWRVLPCKWICEKDPLRRHSSLCLPVPPLSSRWSRWLCQSENSLSTRSNEGQQNPCMELTSNTSKITTQAFSVYGTDLENTHTSSSLRTTSSVLRRWNCFLTEISEVSGLPEWTNQLRSGPFPKMYEITWNIRKHIKAPRHFLVEIVRSWKKLCNWKRLQGARLQHPWQSTFSGGTDISTRRIIALLELPLSFRQSTRQMRVYIAS